MVEGSEKQIAFRVRHTRETCRGYVIVLCHAEVVRALLAMSTVRIIFSDIRETHDQIARKIRSEEISLRVSQLLTCINCGASGPGRSSFRRAIE